MNIAGMERSYKLLLITHNIKVLDLNVEQYHNETSAKLKEMKHDTSYELKDIKHILERMNDKL